MAAKLRSLLAGVVSEDSGQCEEDEDETSEGGFETPPMEEVLENNQTADEL